MASSSLFSFTELEFIFLPLAFFLSARASGLQPCRRSDRAPFRAVPQPSPPVPALQGQVCRTHRTHRAHASWGRSARTLWRRCRVWGYWPEDPTFSLLVAVVRLAQTGSHSTSGSRRCWPLMASALVSSRSDLPRLQDRLDIHLCFLTEGLCFHFFIRKT